MFKSRQTDKEQSLVTTALTRDWEDEQGSEEVQRRRERCAEVKYALKEAVSRTGWVGEGRRGEKICLCAGKRKWRKREVRGNGNGGKWKREC